MKWLLSSDQQFPYHDKRAVDLWFKVLKWFKPDAVDYLGDQSDQACYSKYTDGTTEEFLKAIAKKPDESPIPFVKENERVVKEFYQDTRLLVPDADIFVALGNHDIRVFGYMDKKAPEWMHEITPEALWDFDKLGINYIYYSDLPKERYGGIFVHHGNAALAEAGASVKSDMDKFGVSMMRGHSHRVATYQKTYELRNEILRGWEIGHMSNIKDAGMMYTNVHNWQQAFAVGHVHNGFAHIQVVNISPDYEAVVDGKLFKA